jgi:oligo-alginate lyase
MYKIKLFFLLVLAAHCALAQETVSFQTLKDHPRLFAGDAQIAAIKKQTDIVTKNLLAIIRADAEARLAAAPITYPNGVSNMGTSRAVQGRIIALAMAYRLFNDPRFLQKVKEDLLQLSSISNWGTGHFLDVGEASLAAGIGYDWLYHHLSPAERKKVEEAIKQNALLPGLEAKAGKDSWVNGNFNWNPVCHGGLAVGALAIADVEPEVAKQVVERALKYIPISGEAYSPDGSFAEGPSYWSYGTSFYILAVEALRSALGSSYGLEKIPGFLRTADYRLQMVAPTGTDYNYSDYHTERANEPIMLWFAREQSRPDWVQTEVAKLQRLQVQCSSAPVHGETDVHLSRHTPLEILWWKPAFASVKKGEVPLQWTAAGDMPISVMRSAWNDKTASYITIKGGTSNNSHGHMDVGSFILEAAGVRWALDLGTESYNKMREAKLDLWNYTQNSNRWTTFRVGPEGHNILRVNGERQLITGKGEVKQLSLSNGAMGAEADLTSLYSNKAKNVTRKVVLHPDRSISIHDNWQAGDSAVAVSFQWLTKAAVTKTSAGFRLQQDGKTLDVTIEAPNKNFWVEVQDVSKSTAIQNSDNPGLNRIVISTQTAAGQKGGFRLRASASR